MASLTLAKPNKFLTVSLVLTVYALRWLASLGIGLVVYNVLASGSASQSLAQTSAKSDQMESFFMQQPGVFGDGNLFRNAMAIGFGLFFAFMVNLVISAVAIVKLACHENRLWAFAGMAFIPLFVAGSLASVASILPLGNITIFTATALVDLAFSLVIAWRICINKSPFAGSDLIDASDFSWG